MRGDYSGAVRHFATAVKRLKALTGRRDVLLPVRYEAFHVLALLGTRKTLDARKARRYVRFANRTRGHGDEPGCDAAIYGALECAASLAQGDGEAADNADHITLARTIPCFDRLFVFVAALWAMPKYPSLLVGPVSLLKQIAEDGGFDWVAAEAGTLLDRLCPKGKSDGSPSKGHSELGSRTLLEVLGQKQLWERKLDALDQLSLSVKGRAGRSASRTPSRLAWTIDCNAPTPRLAPYEQKIGKAGKWTAGRAVALKRLSTRKNVPFLTGQDLRVCEAIVPDGDRPGARLRLDASKAFAALVSHPLVFRKDIRAVRVEVVESEPRLDVTTQGDRVLIRVLPEPPDEGRVRVEMEGETRLAVTQFRQRHLHICKLLGDSGLSVPLDSKDRVVRTISSVSSLVTVHSDVGGVTSDAGDFAANPTPQFHLAPRGEGLRIEPLVQPFGDSGPTYAPGEGGEVVFAIVNGKRSRTCRDLGEESRRLGGAVASCPSLQSARWDGVAWTLSDPVQCLELVEDLHELADRVTLKWPQGESLRIRSRATADSLSLKIRGAGDWFSVGGEVDLDEGLVMDLRELLDSLDSAVGRFVPIGERQFVALSKRFMARVEELSSLLDRRGKKELRVHPSRTHAMDDVVGEIGAVDADAEWARRIRRFREAQALRPAVPSTLQADLREYQVQGYRWAARLAAWGAGACLADDMGLGKTVQALAVALGRAPSGPALVVAPTSVCPNWIDEARRFAPTLNAFQFGPGNRAKMLEDLCPYDLMLCSYGLLHKEADLLAEVRWETIVLDEAQAIKNRRTKRSRAAMRLRGGFRMLTTGTPIENHLGELWNLFQFINPGLLGSSDAFNSKLAVPIHQHGSHSAKRTLRRMIRPFILRRIKSAVLDELPARTEITIRVKMSARERALYEALRQRAVESVSQPGSNSHLHILAQIVKLRRACCHPRLTSPGLGIAGAKLESVAFTVDDVLANGHKALIFSQFVDHLAIVREHLDDKGIAYRYLDGSTPAAARKREVDAFQSGDGDLFLISLRAGGQGLNLTAADFVLHLDPWWNPAVEDQASDRAHRIGQKRPVTIYRFVMQDTIEERIVDLHASKRQLADDLLEGADMSGKMSAKELLNLMRAG